MRLASDAWARMEASGSRECRNCHSFDAMSGDIQKQTIYQKRMKAQAAGQTCIDCHKGIAHHLPKEYKDTDEERAWRPGCGRPQTSCTWCAGTSRMLIIYLHRLSRLICGISEMPSRTMPAWIPPAIATGDARP